MYSDASFHFSSILPFISPISVCIESFFSPQYSFTSSHHEETSSKVVVNLLRTGSSTSNPHHSFTSSLNPDIFSLKFGRTTSALKSTLSRPFICFHSSIHAFKSKLLGTFRLSGTLLLKSFSAFWYSSKDA